MCLLTMHMSGCFISNKAQRCRQLLSQSVWKSTGIRMHLKSLPESHISLLFTYSFVSILPHFHTFISVFSVFFEIPGTRVTEFRYEFLCTVNQKLR